MNCTEVTLEIPNYCYGEISSEVEEAVEYHLAACEPCRTELARHRKLLELFDEREPVVDAGLLVQCRSDLSRTLRQQIATDAGHSAGWRGWRNAMRHLHDLSHVSIPFRIPVGAMALVALGFVAARYTPEKFGGVRAALAEPMFSHVRSVEPNASGQVEIAVDETRRHVVSGALQDRQIQELLLTGVRDGSNPNVRVESIRVLHDSVLANSGGPGNTDATLVVRQALLGSLEHDSSAVVRLRALEGLKQFAGDPAVRNTLANVLLKDDNANVRAQAIDLLATHHDDSIVGILQNAVQREENGYVRAQCLRLLAQLNASAGTY
jgi:anti-sigma factor RsiW